jgi:putative Holliday junction resolvase
LDIGDRRIGVAVSDRGGIIASPLTIIERTDDLQDIEIIIAILRENEAGLVIAGLPVSLDGTLGQQARKVKDFTGKLISRTDIPVEYRDESMTTLQARELMQVTRKKKRREKEKDDAIAAAYILQSYLDEKQ